MFREFQRSWFLSVHGSHSQEGHDELVCNSKAFEGSRFIRISKYVLVEFKPIVVHECEYLISILMFKQLFASWLKLFVTTVSGIPAQPQYIALTMLFNYTSN